VLELVEKERACVFAGVDEAGRRRRFVFDARRQRRRPTVVVVVVFPPKREASSSVRSQKREKPITGLVEMRDAVMET
jgi:hypothetical protein